MKSRRARSTLEDFQLHLTGVARLLWDIQVGKNLGRDPRPEELAEFEAKAWVYYENFIVKNLAHSRRSVKTFRRDLRFVRQLQRAHLNKSGTVRRAQQKGSLD